MKYLFFSCIFWVFYHYSNSQSFEGVRKGKFSIGDAAIKYPINLYVVLNKDSIYIINSYSEAESLSKVSVHVICDVAYQFRKQDSVYLEETKVLQPANIVSTCFQKMFLKIYKRKKIITMSGSWTSDSKDCYQSGIITFTKQ